MNFKKNNKILFFLCVFLLAIGSFYIYKYTYQPHQKTENIKAVYNGNTKNFKYLFFMNPEKYNGKVVQLTGKVTSSENTNCILDKIIFCQFNQTLNIKNNQNITLKGHIIGYDELLEEIKINQCILLN